ncbi:MAG: tetratricopeptide repeat protein [Desulfobulbaceae bacterium]|nr:tetratricopeptide repeat protein [Desulfobulbaceae bacterium]
MNIRRPWQYLLFLMLVVLVVFFPVTGFDFLFLDDPLNVQANPLVQNFSLDSFLRFWRQPYEGLYIPLTYTLWGLLATSTGGGAALAPAPFHAANLLLHLAAVTTLFFLLRLLVKDDLAALGGALFFALHPLVVEPVAWVSELKGLLSGFLSFLALWFFLGRPRGTAGAGMRHLAEPHYLLATLFFLAAILAKPSALILPMLAGLLGYLVMARPINELGRELAPWLLLAVPVALVTKFAQAESPLTFAPNLWELVLVAGDALTFYLHKLLWPFALGPDYGRTPAVALAGNLRLLTGLLPWGLLGVALSKKLRPGLVAVAIPVAALLPVLGFVPFTFQGTSTVADRYCYLALLGPALGLALLLARYRGRGVRLGVAALLLCLAVVSSLQLRYWRDSPTLDRHVLDVNPGSWASQYNLGMHALATKQLDAALGYFREVIRLQPGAYLAHFSLGYIHDLQNRPAAAIESYRTTMRLKPDYLPPYSNLGLLYQRQNRLLEASEVFSQALKSHPDFVAGYLNLSTILEQMGRKEEAAATFRQALLLQPNAAGYAELGDLYRQMGQLAAAASAYRQALALQPVFAEAQAKLAEIGDAVRPQPQRP